jgi:cytochrome-b5 reductase
VKVLVCGPPAMEKALKKKKTGVLAELGYKPDQVYSF